MPSAALSAVIRQAQAILDARAAGATSRYDLVERMRRAHADHLAWRGFAALAELPAPGGGLTTGELEYVGGPGYGELIDWQVCGTLPQTVAGLARVERQVLEQAQDDRPLIADGVLFDWPHSAPGPEHSLRAALGSNGQHTEPLSALQARWLKAVVGQLEHMPKWWVCDALRIEPKILVQALHWSLRSMRRPASLPRPVPVVEVCDREPAPAPTDLVDDLPLEVAVTRAQQEAIDAAMRSSQAQAAPPQAQGSKLDRILAGYGAAARQRPGDFRESGTFAGISVAALFGGLVDGSPRELALGNPPLRP